MAQFSQGFQADPLARMELLLLSRRPHFVIGDTWCGHVHFYPRLTGKAAGRCVSVDNVE